MVLGCVDKANSERGSTLTFLLGIPFNDTNNFRLGIAETGTAILGDYLIGLQAGNEPDLYLRHQHRQDVSIYRLP